MNEQMKSKLHKLADTCKHPDNYHQGPWMDYIQFAELIVRECVEQGKQVQSQTVTNVSDDYVNGRAMGIEVFMNQIKEHFGVE